MQEMMTAMRGCVALVTGKRDAPSYFDFSQRGLVSSLIAVLIAVILAGFGPLLVGGGAPGSATQSIIVNVVLFLAQAGTGFIALRTMGRSDGFVPYLTATNWVTLASSALLLVSTLLGALGLVVLLVVLVMALTTFVNIGRFVVTLQPLQIGILFVSQAVGVFFAMALIAVMLGAPAV
jgi:hypothetical protein